MKADQTIFYDINTQRDFVLHDGKFHLEYAEKLVPVWKALTDLARDQKVQIVCSVDCHVPGDTQLKSWGGPYPDHCMAGTPGQNKIDETAPLNPLMLENKEYTPEEIQKVLDHDGEIVFRRQQFEKLADNEHLSAILPPFCPPKRNLVMSGVTPKPGAARKTPPGGGAAPNPHIP